MSHRKVQLSARTALISELLLGLLVTGCGQHQSVDELVASAKQYRQQGNPKAAVIELKNAMQHNPDNGEVRLLLGSIYNDMGDPLSAEKEVRKAMTLGLPPARTLAPLSQALLTQGQYPKVLAETQAQSTGTDAAILTLRGQAYLALNDVVNATAAYSQVLKLRPDDPEALIGLARIALFKKDNAGATAYADQAVARNPQNINALLFKGEWLRSQGKFEASLAMFDQVLKLHPDQAAARLLRAHLEIGNKKFDAAKADIDAVRQSKHAPLQVLYAQARLDFSQGKLVAAMETLLQALRMAPDNQPLLLLAGATQFGLGSMPQAEQYLRKYVDAAPKEVDGRKWLSRALLQDGQAKAARDVLAPVLTKHPQDPELLTLAGESAMQTKDFSAATDYFTRAIALAPQVAAPHAGLGLAALAQDKSKQALFELGVASDLDSQHIQAGVTLLMAQIRLAQYGPAMASMKKFEQEHPDNPIFAKLKGDIYAGTGDVAKARSNYEAAVKLQPSYFPAVESLVKLDLSDGHPDRAKQRLTALLDLDKKNLQALLALANLAAIQHQAKESTVWLERAHSDLPDEMRPAVLLIGQYLNTGATAKALILAKNVQTAHPNAPDVLDVLAKAQFASGDKAGALESYNKLTIALPASALAQFHLAQVYAAMSNVPEATSALKKALSLQPGYIDAQMALAALAVQGGNFNEALTIARAIQKQQPAAGSVFEGDLLMMQNKVSPAAVSYGRAYTLAPVAPVLIKLYDALNRAGQSHQANAQMGAWLKNHPTDIVARMYLGTAALTSHDNKAAAAQFESIVQQYPDNTMALNNLAWAYDLQKDPRALGVAEKAYQAGRDNPAVMDTLGWILVEQGDTERALPLLKKAKETSPQAGDVRYHLAVGMAKAGDKNGARKELEQLLAGDKDFSQIDAARTFLRQL